MKRFMGMMPSSEIKIRKTYLDESDNKITIDAGEEGWTITYADYSTQYKDVTDTSENNFNTALKILKSEFSNISELNIENEEEK